MKKLYSLLIVGITIAGISTLKAQTVMQTCEYWFDYDFEGRQKVAMNGLERFQQEFDLSSLPAGVHSIGLRFGDSDGLWGAPLVKHFVVPSLPSQTFPDNKIVSMEYWIDYDFDNRQTLENTDGTVTLTFDFSTLSPGVHSIAYRALDSRGIWTSPFLKHFVVPSLPEPAITNMVAYEYWFNHGPRIHVDVDPQNPLEISEVMVEVKDVWPNAIRDDYRLDVNSGTVYTDDDVFFGIQALDNLGHATEAVLSETFAMTIPVPTQWTQLTDNIPSKAVAPEVSHIAGFKMPCAAGNLLCWKVEGTEGQIRLNNADGSHLDGEMFRFNGGIGCAAIVTSGQTYALLYDATHPNESITVRCTVIELGDVNADTVIDVADIATVIDYLAGNQSVAKLMADVNSDGIVDIADIAAIIDLMADKTRKVQSN